MSVSAEPSSPPADHPASDERCYQCNAPLAADQEWCLECGAARTMIHRPPDWRIPAAVIATVVALVLAGFAIALTNLSASANRDATSVAPTSTPVATKAATTTPAATTASSTTGRFANWPIGLPGWTVVLAASRDQAAAVASATRIAAAGIPVGVLRSSDHPSLTPGFWTVFSGRYPTQFAAQQRATALIAKGYAGAHIRLVGLPGGR
jgi:hypothetical protein